MSSYFEGCLPVEIIASRGVNSLAYGPMRPVGLADPRTGRWPFAVVQLRREDRLLQSFNLVGFQTNLRHSEQARVFRMIPGLENAEFQRFGQMHRNTFINSPVLLKNTLELKVMRSVYIAGQLCGVEGYLGSIATRLLAGINAGRDLNGQPQLILPEDTMLGSIIRSVTSMQSPQFQPVKANFGLVPPLDDGVRRGKRERAKEYSARALRDLGDYLYKQ